MDWKGSSERGKGHIGLLLTLDTSLTYLHIAYILYMDKANMFDEEKDHLEQQGRENTALETALRSIEKRLNPNDFDFKDLQAFRHQLKQPKRESLVEILHFFNQLKHYKGMRDGHPEGVLQSEWNMLVSELAKALEPILARKVGYLLDDLRRSAHSSPKGYAEMPMPYNLFAFTRDTALETAKDRFEHWFGKPAYRFPGKIPWGWPQFTLSVWEWRYDCAILRLQPDDTISFGVALREDKLNPTVLKRLEQVSRGGNY